MLARICLLAGLIVTCLGPSQQPALAGESELKPVTYSVADLVIPINVEGNHATKSRVTASLPASFEANLVHAIATGIDPASWAEVGGPGTIRYCKDRMELAVVQTPANHERIADLLALMRRFNALEVALEVRMLTVPDSLFAHLESDFGIHLDWIQLPCTGSQRACASEKTVAFISASEDARLTEAFESDRRAHVFCAPKVTVFNGQAASVTVGDTKFFTTKVTKQVGEAGQVFDVAVQEPFEVGFKMVARPVVSADRRFIRVAFDISNTELAPQVPLVPVQLLIPPVEKNSDGPVVFKMNLQKPQLNTQQIASTVVVPDGGTAVFCGLVKKPNPHAKADGSAIAKIPYVNRLFSEPAGYAEPSRVLIMVTPRIIINDEMSAPPPVAVRSVSQPPRVPPAPTSGIVPVVYTAVPAPALPMPSGPSRTTTLVSDLLKAYDEACAAGYANEAERLARAALALDATCFHGRR